MTTPESVFFLPGASGNIQFWHPVAERLRSTIPTRHIGWPGFGNTAPSPKITSLKHLASLALDEIDRPTALVAQSMGGVVAIHMALERPELITHLTLAVTSGGMDVSALGAEDWRTEFETDYPNVPRWFLDDRTDLTARLHELRMPALLLWGGSDPISPLRVGQLLAQRIPGARLKVFPEAAHDLGRMHAREVANLIDEHHGF